MSNTTVFAGKLAQAGEDPDTNGSASVNAEDAEVTVLGTVTAVYGGGKAVGRDAESLTGHCAIDILGTVQRAVYGGGSAIDGGYTLSEDVEIHLAPEAKITGNIYCGGYAEIIKGTGMPDEPSSFSEVTSVTIRNEADFPTEHIFENGIYEAGGDGFVDTVQYQ